MNVNYFHGIMPFGPSKEDEEVRIGMLVVLWDWCEPLTRHGDTMLLVNSVTPRIAIVNGCGTRPPADIVATLQKLQAEAGESAVFTALWTTQRPGHASVSAHHWVGTNPTHLTTLEDDDDDL